MIYAILGSAYIYGGSGTVWSRQGKVVAPDGVASDFFGTGVAAASSSVIVGCPYDGTQDRGIITRLCDY